jgi:acyl carrier protein
MQQPANESDDQAVLDGELQHRLTAAEPAEREKILTETVREHASAVLEQPSITSDTNFFENGLTSIRAIELINRLTALTGIEIPLVSIIDHPTPADLGQYMAGTLAETA